jgi:hypothetical protein
LKQAILLNIKIYLRVPYTVSLLFRPLQEICSASGLLSAQPPSLVLKQNSSHSFAIKDPQHEHTSEGPADPDHRDGDEKYLYDRIIHINVN